MSKLGANDDLNRLSYDQLRSTAYVLVGEQTLTEELLNQVGQTLARLSASTDDIERIKIDLRQNIGITGVRGFGLQGRDQVPWLDNRRSQIKWNYSDAWREWMISDGTPRQVIRSIESDVESILGMCGDPTRDGSWFIRGLVMGDVQSGKTANYSALVNKAVDAGYRLIILLAGMSNDLRSQTQERLDEAFVGRLSSNVLPEQSRDIGVQPRRGKSHVVTSMTSVSSDFLTSGAKVFSRGAKLSFVAKNSPVLFVMKKNKHPLEQLISYLDGMGDPEYAQLPLLVIDDEADNASVNTKDENEDPATINQRIRDLLDRFQRRTYCAYTATPFANAFINPDDESEIFPDNFIYVLNAPSNYIGVSQIFDDDGSHSASLRSNTDDIEKFFPQKHKKNHPVNALPGTLQTAIRTFFLTCAIRDLRGERLRHRTMLINVSLYNEVQKQLTELVSDYVDDLQQYMRQYLASDAVWQNYPILKELEETYYAEFSGIESWDKVRAALYDSVSNVKPLLINQSITDANERLNYKHYKNERLGRRVIAIGGLSLSRGLTLEGLSTSYFYRHSKAYDTLLQMGRWFGYRPGYDDLCRVWMDGEAVKWYRHIGSAVAELRDELRQMMHNKQTPRDFSIRVRSHESGLLVTARNKMRTSKEVYVEQNFAGRIVDTPIFYRNGVSPARENLQNLESVRDFLNSIRNLFDTERASNEARLWSGVPKDRIAGFVDSLLIPPQNFPFMRDADGIKPIVGFIREEASDSMRVWDVVLQQGESETIGEFLDETYPANGARQFSPVTRRFAKPTRGGKTISANNSQIGQPSDPIHGMSATEVASARDAWVSVGAGRKNPSAKHYLTYRSRPILTIYVIEGNSYEKILGLAKLADLEAERKGDLRQAIANNEELGNGLYVGISIGFPGDSSVHMRRVRYRLNLVAQRNAGFFDNVDEFDSEDIG